VLRGGGVPPWPTAYFASASTLRQNIANAGNVEQSRLKAAALPHVKLIFPESPL